MGFCDGRAVIVTCAATDGLIADRVPPRKLWRAT